MIELINNALVFRFPEVHSKTTCTIDFQRTLRIPDDNREYSLSLGLGRFPVECQTASKIDQVSACNFDQVMRPDCGV